MPNPCPDPEQVVPSTPGRFGTPLPAKMRAVRVNQRHSTNLVIPILQAGQPVDLSCFFPSESDSESEPTAIKVRWSEVSGLSHGVVEADASLLDTNPGTISVSVPSAVTACGGIYRTNVGIYRGDTPVYSYELFTIVESNIAGGVPSGPPTVPEIRLHMADQDAGQNLLIGDHKFDDAEIAACIYRPVSYFNEALPILDVVYDTTNFPSRYHYLEAIVGHLYLIAAEYYRANHLPYSAGRTSIDDMNKYQQYQEAGMQKLAEFKQWVRSYKIKLNIDDAWGAGGYVY